jgi:hypothetical protein
MRSRMHQTLRERGIAEPPIAVARRSWDPSWRSRITRHGGGEDPWLCDPGFGRVCSWGVAEDTPNLPVPYKCRQVSRYEALPLVQPEQEQGGSHDGRDHLWHPGDAGNGDDARATWVLDSVPWSRHPAFLPSPAATRPLRRVGVLARAGGPPRAFQISSTSGPTLIGVLRRGGPARTLALTRPRRDYPQPGAVRPIARLAHVAPALRRAVQEVDPRFSRTCSARTGEPDGLRTVWGWKPELPRPHRKRFSLGGGHGKRNGEVNSPTPGS